MSRSRSEVIHGLARGREVVLAIRGLSTVNISGTEANGASSHQLQCLEFLSLNGVLNMELCISVLCISVLCISVLDADFLFTFFFITINSLQN